MLDSRFIRENVDTVREAIRSRNEPADLDRFLHLDERKRALQVEVEGLRQRRNHVSEQIAALKKHGEEPASLITQIKVVSQKIKAYACELRALNAALEQVLLSIPNIPDLSVPRGSSDSDNVEVRRWGHLPELPFSPLPHWELGGRLGILDLKRASKIAGSGFVLFRGAGARLKRALISFMLDVHTEQHGYTEVLPPFLTVRAAMTGTGQLPKMEGDMYRCEEDDLFLVPTAEVPVTNIHRDEILHGTDLPLCYVAYTPCFRREAGAPGRETRGLIRVHQFDKVELVQFVKPESSLHELEHLVRDAEKVLQLLELPYRIVSLCTGNLSFASAKRYTIEVWAAGVGRYLPVSSCSSYTDFQARRANIRFRRSPRSKPEFVHTLNGSGLALPRTVVAIMENQQLEEGTIRVPAVLRPYMGGMEVIEGETDGLD